MFSGVAFLVAAQEVKSSRSPALTYAVLPEGRITPRKPRDFTGLPLPSYHMRTMPPWTISLTLRDLTDGADHISVHLATQIYFGAAMYSFS